MNNKLCDVTVSYKNQFGFHAVYAKCGAPAKFKVSYKEGTRGKKIVSNQCGVHCNATKKNAERMKTKYGFDSKLKVENI